MNDRLEEVKGNHEHLFAGEINPYTGEVILLSPEDYEYLIAEIESLTKERDELKPYELLSPFKDAKIKELEAENVELTEKAEKDRKYIHDIETRCDPAGDVQRMTSLEEQVGGLEVKLATSEKVGQERLEKILYIRLPCIKCNICGSVYPDKHIHPCTL